MLKKEFMKRMWLWIKQWLILQFMAMDPKKVLLLGTKIL